jgi:hypothetical protein
VAARADLVVERAVDLVLLRSEDGGEVVGHDCGSLAVVPVWVGIAMTLERKMAMASCVEVVARRVGKMSRCAKLKLG